MLITVYMKLQDVVLPKAKVDDIDANVKRLLNWNNKLKNYWKASPYVLEDKNSKSKHCLYMIYVSLEVH